jgi:hypothetical protein
MKSKLFKFAIIILSVFIISCGETKKTELEEIQEKIDAITTPESSTGDSDLLGVSTYQSSDNVCLNSEDFIKQDLNYPSTADFSIFDCSVDNNSDGSYTIMRKVGAKNAFGVESEFIYKVTLGFTGGNDLDIKNWKLINLRSEEVR